MASHEPSWRSADIPIQHRLRPMTPADLEPLVAAILADDFGDRRTWFEFAIRNPAGRPLVAEAVDGSLIGTGVLSIHGSVGWVGTIWVAPHVRRQGLGREITASLLEIGDAAGCRSFVLTATEAGRPLYEGLGFEVQTSYRIMEAPPASAGRTARPNADFDDIATRLRAFRAGDLPALVALDQQATGEDRGVPLGLLATPDGTRVLERDGEVVGFLARAPWGGGATVAPRPLDAIELIEARLRAAGPERRVRCGILLENEAGARALEARGWTEAWHAPRLLRGEPLDWHPEWIWGQFNHAMG